MTQRDGTADKGERAISAVLRALREPAAFLQSDGRIVEVNAPWSGCSLEPQAPPPLTAGPGTSVAERCRTAAREGFDGEVLARIFEGVLSGEREDVDLEYAWPPAGASRTYLVTATALRTADQTGALVVHRDITAQKLAQTSLARGWDFYVGLLDDFPALIWKSGPDGRSSWFNRTWRTFTGRAVEAELGDGWREGMHPADRDGYGIAVSSAMAARQPFQIEFRLRRADGEYRWLVATGRPLHDPDGGFAGYVCSAQDITEPRRAEAAAIEARAAVRAAEARALSERVELLERELGELEAFRGRPSETGLQRTVGSSPLNERSPEVFSQLSQRYAELLDLALERQAWRDVTASPSTGLREVAERLGTLLAGPRDVVELHADVLRAKTAHVPAARRQAYLAEGRLMALELMGHLVSWYRQRALTAAP